ncbi:MAG TPA: response regulator [Geminicoccaceae bacterium]
MTRFEPVLRHLPGLRRYAYASTGSREKGDECVRATLQALVAAPDVIDQAAVLVSLFRLFHEVNDLPSLTPRIGSGEPVSAEARLFLQIATVERESRAALLLAHVIGLTHAEVGQILDLDEPEVARLVAAARHRLGRLASAQVLIIEDDYLIAHEIQRVVENMGQRVIGPAATFEEAMACAAHEAPTLVLADVQLRDGRVAGLLAGNALAREHHVPLIVITAYPERLAQEAEVQPQQIFTKPFSYASLQSAITDSLMAPAAA